MKTLVDEAGIYPGLPPRRIKLVTVRQTALQMSDIDRVVAGAVIKLSELRQRLLERLAVPVGAANVVVIVQPERIVAIGDQVAVNDGSGDNLLVTWPDAWSNPTVRAMMHEPGGWAIVGMMELAVIGPRLRCLALIGDLGWVNGPTYPELS